ncbi:MAG: type II secretion system F family protein [Pseudomonadales bacterium]|jgi:type IV pilus assembly protein PilC|nr:type II secretion system F family protein [Pseudomonadales bacterium]
MAFFDYKAKDDLGYTQNGKIEATSIKQAGELLREKNMFIISIEPAVESSMAKVEAYLNKAKFDDVVAFTRQLSTMIEAGLPLTTALSILVLQSKPAMARVINELLVDIEGGSTLSSALERHSKIFSDMYIQLVKSGEASGSLDSTLSRLADNMEETKEFRGKVKGAMIYPIIITIVMLAIIVLMMVVVVPQLTSIFDEFGAELPLPTRILIGMSNLFVYWWWAMLLAIGAAVGLFFLWYRDHRSKLAFEIATFKLPIYGDLRKKIILTDFTRTFSTLIRSGIPMVEALEISTGSADSHLYKEYLAEVKKKVEKGIGLGVSMAAYEEFPPIVYQMVLVGEETGKVDEVLFRVSNYFKAEAERAVQGLMAALEPIIMVVLGIGVAFLVIAIILPIFELTGQIAA